MLFRKSLIFFLLFYVVNANAQLNYQFITSDIDNFWIAYDKLSTADSRVDSIKIFQDFYIDKASKPFQKFIKARKFTASEYVNIIVAYPKFWKSIRQNTLELKNRKILIDTIFTTFKKQFKKFKTPDICFAIGNFNTGGTTSKKMLLIGAEIVLADSTVDLSEMYNPLKNVLGKNDAAAYIAHETVHTMQRGIPISEIFKLIKYKRFNLLNQIIIEGSADFITNNLLALNINKNIYAYGENNACELWKNFKKDVEQNRYNYGNWLYNRYTTNNQPVDLGYYIGNKISAAYYNKKTNKNKALKQLLRRGKYKKIIAQSGYSGGLNCK